MTTITHARPSLDGPPVGAPAPAVWGVRLATGLGGVLVAAMMSGLNNRVGALTLTDMSGGIGISSDAAQWAGTIYGAAELAAMPISAWFAGTFSFRRMHLGITLVFLACALLLPFAPSYGWLITLRAVQGFAGGAMIPLLMSAALRFLPPAIKLHGLGLYSLTATFAPNLALWLAASWVDDLGDWRLIYWQVVPVALFALGAVWWGIPQDPMRPERMREIDWPALLTGPLGLALLAVALQQGERLDWFNSPLILGLVLTGAALLLIFLISEWSHHLPFIRLQLLGRRNIGLGLPLFIVMLLVISASSALPSTQLTQIHGFRPLQIAPIGLIISIPQLLLAPLVSALLYWRKADARLVASAGLLLMATGCWLGSRLTSDWMVAQFALAQACQMVGQPMAIISFLFLATSVAAPMEGQFVSGLVNMLVALAKICGAVIVQRFLSQDSASYLNQMTEASSGLIDLPVDPGALLSRYRPEALTLAISDLYLLVALVAAALVVPTLLMTHIAPPQPAPKD